jgi:hypothetical protein
VPSYPTANELINMVKSDNDQRQQEMNEWGVARRRSLDVRIYVVVISLHQVADIFS